MNIEDIIKKTYKQQPIASMDLLVFDLIHMLNRLEKSFSWYSICLYSLI